jgi:hypothetical protein
LSCELYDGGRSLGSTGCNGVRYRGEFLLDPDRWYRFFSRAAMRVLDSTSLFCVFGEGALWYFSNIDLLNSRSWLRLRSTSLMRSFLLPSAGEGEVGLYCDGGVVF